VVHRIRRQDPCEPYCSAVNSALDVCLSDDCLCPPILASGLQCSSCLATVDGDLFDAFTLGTIYGSCSATPFTDPCDGVCSNVVTAVSTCTVSDCLCPTILASALQCSSCLSTVDADFVDATSLASLYTSCATSPAPSLSLTLASETSSMSIQPTQTPITSKGVPTRSTTVVASGFVQSTSSSASEASVILAAGYVKLTILLAVIVGMFCVYI